MKESIFNVIFNKIKDSRVIDLYSGSGSLGIEALSRGAKTVYFVDNSIKSIKLIKNNLELLKGLEASFKIIKSDVNRFLRNYNDFTADIIFIDPPYKIEVEEMLELFSIMKDSKIAGYNTDIIYEYFFKREISKEIEGLKLIKNSFFGDKIVSYISL